MKPTCVRVMAARVSRSCSSSGSSASAASTALADGLAGREGVVLGEVADAHAAAGDDLAFVGGFAAGEDLQQRRFAGTVGADQPDPFAGPQFDPQIGEQRTMAETLGEAAAAEQKTHAHFRES